MAGTICFLFVCFFILPQIKLVLATFVMSPNEIEDRVVQAMAAIGFTIEPNSQIDNSLTFLAGTSRLVVTNTTSGIEVVGMWGLILYLANQLDIKPQKNM